MSRGKFESGNHQTGAARPAARRAPARKKRKTALPVVAVVAALALLAVGIFVFVKTSREKNTKIADNVYVCGVNLGGMNRAQAETALTEAIGDAYQAKDLVLSMSCGEQTDDASDAEDNGKEVLTLKPADTNISVDVEAAAAAALEAEPAAERFDVDPAKYLKFNEQYLRTLTEEKAKQTGIELTENKIEERTEKENVEVTLEDGTTETQRQDVQYLDITLGISQRSFQAQELYDAILAAYGNLQFDDAAFVYELKTPEKLDVEGLAAQYCTEPVDAAYDPKTFEITPEVVGFGFDKEALQQWAEEAKEGDVISVKLETLIPEATAEKLQEALFSDVLGECHSPHVWNNDRTNNLIKACEAIDGTILLPGDEFSFNNVVGERTAAKGYRQALVYVAGASKPELGGGVCQVASTIYYATLMADLKVTERTEHMYAVSYVPKGLDATVYWKQYDYRFINTTPYPIRIDASVSDGKVHILLVGTETRDYTVELTYSVLSSDPWETKEIELDENGEYKGEKYEDGDIITTPYTGYKVISYMRKYDADGNEISTTKIDDSFYRRRDQEVAKAIVEETTEPETTEPDTTEPSTEPTTEPSTEPTTAPVTEPPTEAPTDPT